MGSEKKKSNKGMYFIFFLIAVAFSFLMGGLLQTLSSGEDINIKSVIDNMFVGNSYVYAIAIVGVIILLIIATASPKKGGSLKGRDSMENQRFMTEKEMDKNFVTGYFEDVKNLSLVGSVPFSAVAKNGRIKIHFVPKGSHCLIVGATGTGKTVSFIEPALQIISEQKNKPSFFVTDTKGELYAHHSKKLQDSGYDIVLLDLADPYNSKNWNPLEPIYDRWQKARHLETEILKHTNDPISNYDFIKVGQIDNSEWYEFDGKAFSTLREALNEVEVNKTKIRDGCLDDITDICTAICPVSDGQSRSWEQGAQDYFHAVLIAMLEDSDNDALGMTREKYNFYNAYKIAMNKEDDFEVVKQYFNGRSPLSSTRQLSANITQTNAKQTRDGFMSSLSTMLSMFSDNAICYLTSKNDIHFSEMDEKPTAFFIKIPDEKITRYSLASLCINQAYKELVDKARRNEKVTEDHMAHLKRPMVYLLDEFANLPKIQNLDKVITVARSRWIYLNMAIQSYSQLDTVYGKDVASIVRGQCKATIYMGTPDLETRKQFSEELGKRTIEVSSKSESKGKAKDSSSSSTSTSLQEVPLVYASDLDRIPLGENYTKIFQQFPIKTSITPYFKCLDTYKIGCIETPFIPGQRLNEEKVFYDIRKRNSIVLNYDN